MEKSYRCPACGVGVQGYEVSIGGFTEVRCLSCGIPLEKVAFGPKVRFRRALVADDSDFFTEGVEALLLSRGLAHEVHKARDGAQALEVATAALKDRRPVTLAILDFLMPRLNGLHTAVALRAVESAFTARRSAVLFLSARRLDEGLKPTLEDLKPAYYVNKGAGEGVLVGERLETVIRAIASAQLTGTHQHP